VAEGADRLVLDADDTLTLNGAPVEPEALGGRLEALRGRRLNVLADAKASLGLTVRVLDACKAAGVEAQIYARPAEP
jgi:biopolymer transport protein ExbD